MKFEEYWATLIPRHHRAYLSSIQRELRYLYAALLVGLAYTRNFLDTLEPEDRARIIATKEHAEKDLYPLEKLRKIAQELGFELDDLFDWALVADDFIRVYIAWACYARSTKTRVVRIRRQNKQIVQDCDVYIGRQQCQGGWRLKKSIWANPYNLKEYTIGESLRKYEKDVRKNTELVRRLPELEGKVLGCWCKPNPCHGDVLLKLLEEQRRLNYLYHIPYWTTFKRIGIAEIVRDHFGMPKSSLPLTFESSNLVNYHNTDMLSSSAEALAQQCNCTSKRPMGLSTSIFQAFPLANIYRGRTKDSTPGTIVVSSTNPRIINILAQYHPGKPRGDDTAQQRLLWFRQALQELGRYHFASVAFPGKIGCGLAGGDWNRYHEELANFARTHPETVVAIYFLNE